MKTREESSRRENEGSSKEKGKINNRLTNLSGRRKRCPISSTAVISIKTSASVVSPMRTSGGNEKITDRGNVKKLLSYQKVREPQLWYIMNVARNEFRLMGFTFQNGYKAQKISSSSCLRGNNKRYGSVHTACSLIWMFYRTCGVADMEGETLEYS